MRIEWCGVLDLFFCCLSTHSIFFCHARWLVSIWVVNYPLYIALTNGSSVFFGKKKQNLLRIWKMKYITYRWINELLMNWLHNNACTFMSNIFVARHFEQPQSNPWSLLSFLNKIVKSKSNRENYDAKIEIKQCKYFGESFLFLLF